MTTLLEYNSIKLTDKGLTLSVSRPSGQETWELDNVNKVAQAIRLYGVIGSGALVGTALAGLALEANNQRRAPSTDFFSYALEEAFLNLQATCPASASLAAALSYMRLASKRLKEENLTIDEQAQGLLAAAKTYCDHIVASEEKVAGNLLPLIGEDAVILLTAGCSSKSALGKSPILTAVEKARRQGANAEVVILESQYVPGRIRMAVQELQIRNIPFSVIADTAVNYTIKTRRITAAMLPVLRITRRGDAVGYTGSAFCALAASHAGIPVYTVGTNNVCDPDSPEVDKLPLQEAEMMDAPQKGEIRVFRPVFDLIDAGTVTAYATECPAYRAKSVASTAEWVEAVKLKAARF